MNLAERIIRTPQALANFMMGLKPNQKVVEPLGVSGTSVWGETFQEEYLSDLKGNTGSKQYDKMLRQDYQVKYIETATVGTIKSATYGFTVPDDPRGMDMKKACEWQMRKGMNKTWSENLNDILSYMTFGYAALEPVQWGVHDRYPE